MFGLVQAVQKGFGRIHYKDLPSYCTHCMRIGHALGNCKKVTIPPPNCKKNFHVQRFQGTPNQL